MNKLNRKGQLTLADAPSVVLIVGLIFLIMATMAFISQKYGDSLGSTVAERINNESVVVTTAGTQLATFGTCNFGNAVAVIVTNNSNSIIPASNYTLTSAGVISNQTGATLYGSTWKVSYTFTTGGVACNVTQDLNTEIANNTSIAGIVLTISLVGIVLTVLIGIFLVARAPSRP